MRRAHLGLGLASLASMALAGQAMATPTLPPIACVNFQVEGLDLNLDYNPFSPTPVDHPFVLKVTRMDHSVQGVEFNMTDATPDAGRSRIGPAGPFDYDLIWRDNTGQQVFEPHPTTLNPGDTVTTSFNTGDTQYVHMALRIPPGQSVAASRQSENVEVQYQCISNNRATGAEQVQDDSRFRIKLDIPRYFGAYIGSPGQERGRIDFGTLDGDDSQAEKFVAVTAVSTVPYTINVMTDRGSALRRDDHDPDGIPYTMEFANIPVRDHSLLSCPMTHSSLGDTEQLKVKLDGHHLDALRAGAYRDTITLTFSPSDMARHSPGCQLQP